MWTQNVPSADSAYFVTLSLGAVSRGLGRDYNAALYVRFCAFMKTVFPRTAQEKTIRGIVFLRKAMSLHEREGVPARETRVLGGIGSAPRQR